MGHRIYGFAPKFQCILLRDLIFFQSNINFLIFTKNFFVNFFRIKHSETHFHDKRLKNYFNFQAFEAAKFPVVPYTLALDVWLDGADGGTYTTWQVEELMLTNKTTNEQFSVEKEMDEEEMFVQIITITIKRGLKKKDGELNELVKEQ